MLIDGHWYQAKSTHRERAQLSAIANHTIVVHGSSDKQPLSKCDYSDVDISPRVGNTARYLTFPDGGKFETTDNDAVDTLRRECGESHWLDRVHLMESGIRYVLPLFAILIVISWATVKFGIPSVSKWAAHSLPAATLDMVSDQTLSSLDDWLFDGSQLSVERRNQIRNHLLKAIEPLQHPNLELKIYFRGGEKIGANAFALPDGSIVFTDQLIELSQHPNEILAIFAHEVGHVAHRHGMRMIIQDSLLFFLLTLLVGDVSAVAELFLALPIVLTETAYSRDFEREADAYALSFLQGQNINPQYFATIMRRMEKAYHCKKTTDKQPDTDIELEACITTEPGKSIQEQKDDQVSPLWDYLSTHPATEERLKPFEQPQQ